MPLISKNPTRLKTSEMEYGSKTIVTKGNRANKGRSNGQRNDVLV